MGFIIGLYNFFCSLKAAVLTLSILIVLFATGTIYESLYGREAAQEVIYQSIWMSLAIFCLALNITAVMIDRWPWKKRHAGFLMAHIGILIVLTGSLLTRFYGVDGNMRLTIGGKSQQILTSSSLLAVYSSFDGHNLTELYREKVHFFKKPPHPDKPFIVPLGAHQLNVINHHPFASARENYETAEKGGVAIRFSISGSQATIVRWLFKSPWMDQASLDLGPAQIILKNSSLSKTENKLNHNQTDNSSLKSVAKLIKKPRLLLSSSNEELQYELNNPHSKKIRRGTLKTGSILNLGWMDFQFRLISYLPQALPNTIFTAQKRTGDNTLPAIQVSFKGENRWLGLNSYLFFFDEDKVFVIAYSNERKNLSFELQLQDFKILRYPSSSKAASYESGVLLNGQTSHLISMNNPLKRDGYTVYQAGFEENEDGVPVASIFSINKDPGRWLKYLGSLLIVLGTIMLFSRRNRKRKS